MATTLEASTHSGGRRISSKKINHSGATIFPSFFKYHINISFSVNNFFSIVDESQLDCQSTFESFG